MKVPDRKKTTVTLIAGNNFLLRLISFKKRLPLFSPYSFNDVFQDEREEEEAKMLLYLQGTIIHLLSAFINFQLK